jgi:putative selenate reductase
MKHLHQAMMTTGSQTITQFIKDRAGLPAEASVNKAGKLVTEHITDKLNVDPRYHLSNNQKTPPKIDSQLQLFDCITCNKCLPVCPNAANFSIPTGTHDLLKTDYRIENDELIPVSAGRFVVEKQNQIINLADFCNECGDCDTYCPEYGGPFIEKPRFFFSKESYDTHHNYDGFYMVAADEIKGRIAGVEYSLHHMPEADNWRFESPQAEMILSAENKLISGKVLSENSGSYIDMEAYNIMKTIFNGIQASQHNYASILLCDPGTSI